MKRPTTQEWTLIVTVIGVAGGLIMLYIAVSGISSTEITVNELRNLVNTSAQQLKILINQSNTQSELLETENQAVVELAHQTIMQVYNFEQPHKVDVSSCYYYPDDKKIVFHLRIMYKPKSNDLNSEYLPSTLTFKIKPIMHGKLEDKQSKEVPFSIRSPSFDYQLVSPSQENIWEFFLSDIFEDIKDAKIKDENSIFYMRTQYSFAPFSIAKNSPLSDLIKQEGHLLVGLEKSENERWVMIKGNEKIVCN